MPEITALRVAYHLLGLAYNFALLPGTRRIKELYFWKNTASATGFMLTVFGYPLASVAGGSLPDGITWMTVGVTGAFFFLFEISYEVIYDLRDVAGDRQAGVRTYPVVHGEKAAQRIVTGLIVASIASLSIGYGLGAVPWRIFVMVAAPVIQLLFVRQARRRGFDAGDCIGLTLVGALLLVIYHLWIVADLPGVT
jgi:4-hydroxybenzoate polyprenyltransferase